LGIDGGCWRRLQDGTGSAPRRRRRRVAGGGDASES